MIGCFISIFTASFEPLQNPVGSLFVILRVTAPAFLSATLGVYVGVNELTLEKVPVPDVVHVGAIVDPIMLPARVTVEPEQIV